MENFVTELSTEHLPAGNTPGFACNVPACLLDGNRSGGTPGRVSELFELAEYLVHITGIHTQDAAFEHKRIRRARTIPDLTVAGDTLVGIQPDHVTQ